jgi:hypothetical protein
MFSMTMVAALWAQKYPVMIGDILLSGPENCNKDVYIPTIGNVDKIFPEGSGYSITGLSQKLTIVNDKLVVGWVGMVAAAMLTIKELMKQSARRDFHLDDIRAFCENDVDSWCWENLGIVGFGNDGTNLFSFGVNNRCFVSSRFGEAKIVGTGADRFLEIASSIELPPPITSMNPLECAISDALLLSNYMLGEETNGLLQFYGGGFEIVSFIRKTYRKVGDITYMFWHAQIMDDKSIKLSLPKLAFKFTYYNDLLVVRRAEFEGNITSDGILKCEDKNVHLITPIYRSIQEEEISNFKVPTFNSRFICHYILVEKQGVPSWILSRITYNGGERDDVVFLEKDNQKLSGINLKDEFLKSIFMSIRE